MSVDRQPLSFNIESNHEVPAHSPFFKSPEEKEKDREAFLLTSVVVNGGGQGERLREMEGNWRLQFNPETGKITKILTKVMPGEDDRILDRHLKHLLNRGFADIVIGAGNHHNVADYVKGNKGYDKKVEVSTFDNQLDTGGDLIRTVRSSNLAKYTLVENGDTIVLFDEGEFIRAHQESGAAATMLLTGRKKVPDEGQWLVDTNGLVLKIFTTEEMEKIKKDRLPAPVGTRYLSSTGAVIFNTNFLEKYPWQESQGRLSLYRDNVDSGLPGILPHLIEEGQLRYFDAGTALMYDVGTPPNFNKTLENEAFVQAIDKYYT